MTALRQDALSNADHSKLHYVYYAAGQKTRFTLTTPDGQSRVVDYAYGAVGNLKTPEGKAAMDILRRFNMDANSP